MIRMPTFADRACRVAVMAVALLGAVALHAQDAGNTSLSFEVVSIRQNTFDEPAGVASGAGGVPITVRGKRLVAINASLRDIIRYAYRLEPFQALEGGPRWLDDRFDITAVIPDSVSAADAPRLMLQTLLADRFKLSVRRASREYSTYALVVARGDGRPGPALTPSTMDCEAWRRERQNDSPEDRLAALREAGQSRKVVCDMVILPYVASIVANGMTMGDLARVLSARQAVGGPVENRTGLRGAFDFELKFAAGAPGPSADATAREPGALPPLVVALEEQLGLRLERSRGSIEALLIERIEPLSKE